MQGTLRVRVCAMRPYRFCAPPAAFRSGAVMGFLLASFGLAALFGTLLVFRHFYDGDWTGLYEAITGFGLGGSAIALFGRVGGGIYTKAADVGADLVGKVR
jgi:H+-translocating diphosphatase